jgi:hypothetical protein
MGWNQHAKRFGKNRRIPVTGRETYWSASGFSNLVFGLGVGLETHLCSNVDPNPFQIHIIGRSARRVFELGGSMRTARKAGHSQDVTAGVSGSASSIATVEPRESSVNLSVHASLNGWIAPQGIRSVPTHAVTVPNERRGYPRAKLQLPSRITRISGRREPEPPVFHTVDISSSGLFARCPFNLEPGTTVDLEVELVKKPAGRGTIRMLTQAHVVRAEPDAKRGWHALAFTFDDISFQRDDSMPPRFIRH